MRFFAQDDMMDALLFYNLQEHIFWSNSYFHDMGYSDRHDYEVQNNINTDGNDSSDWSDFGGGGGFSDGGGASGSW